jgi:hypothetical protein
MTRSLLLGFLAVFSLAFPATAQWRIEPGLAVGMQPYSAYEDDPRILTEADLVVRRGNWGGHVALQYADLAFAGWILVTHANAVVRFELPRGFAVLGGGGLTYVSPEQGGSLVTGNVELELSKQVARRVDVFARARHYEFQIPSYRSSETGPDGPSLHIGARLRLR